MEKLLNLGKSEIWILSYIFISKAIFLKYWNGGAMEILVFLHFIFLPHQDESKICQGERVKQKVPIQFLQEKVEILFVVNTKHFSITSYSPFIFRSTPQCIFFKHCDASQELQFNATWTLFSCKDHVVPPLPSAQIS